jgi:hypothetical protein
MRGFEKSDLKVDSVQIVSTISFFRSQLSMEFLMTDQLQEPFEKGEGPSGIPSESRALVLGPFPDH